MQMKRLPALLLTAAVCLSLTACQKDAAEGDKPAPPQNGAAAPAIDSGKPDELLGSGGTYTYTASEIVPESDIGNVLEFFVQGGRIYFTSRPELADTVELYSMNLDGSDVHKYESFSQGGKLCVDGDGVMWTVRTEEIMLSSGMKGSESVLVRLDKDGGDEASYSCDFLGLSASSFPWRMEFGADGLLYIQCVGAQGKVCAVDLSAEPRLKFSLNVFSPGAGMAKRNDGVIVVGGTEQDNYMLKAIDSRAESWGETKKLEFGRAGIDSGIEGGHSLFIRAGSTTYAYDWHSGSITKLFNNITAGIDLVGIMVPLESDSFLQYGGPEMGSGGSFWLIEKKELFGVDSVVTLKLAAMDFMSYMSYSPQVLQFNRSHDEVKIEILDYSVYNTGDLDDAGMVRLMTEIMSGNVPDIYDLSSLPAAQYAARGMLVDLYPYIDADPGINLSDYDARIMKSLEIGGCLYEITPSVTFITMLGARSCPDTGGRWSVDEFSAFISSVPEGKMALGESMSRYDFLSTMLDFCGSDFVDWSAKKCNFESESFMGLLEYAKTLPAEIRTGSYETWYDDWKEINAGNQLLSIAYINDVSSLELYAGLFGGEIRVMGFPTPGGSGTAVSANAPLAISSLCADKDAAWSFLRELLLDDRPRWNGFPLSESGIKDSIETHIERSADSSGEYHAGSVVFHADTEYAVSKLPELLESVGRAYRHDENVYNIVVEEAAAFFAGDKTAQETARLIQSRIQIYVAEQS